MDAISPDIGDVVVCEHPYEDEAEFYEDYQNATTGLIDLWLIETRAIEEVEGDAIGENYSIYKLQVRYVSCRVADSEWSKKARLRVEQVRDALNGAAAIFAISGQRQIRTPETVSLESHGKRELSGQTLYESVLTMDVEARRW